MRSRGRTEVLAYLALIQVSMISQLFPNYFHFLPQNIVDAMAGSRNWKAAAKDSKLDKMHADITKIVADF